MVSFTTNKTEQTRGGQKETQVPMEVDRVSGSEPEEEDWADVLGKMCTVFEEDQCVTVAG